MSTKFSQFASGGTIGVGAQIAGLDASVSPDNRIFDFPGLGILDTNGSVLLGWSQPISGTAVNYLEFQNALSGNPAVISALGGDTDVGLYLTTQGDGSISLVPGTNGFVVAAGTTALGLPAGTTAQRPVVVSGGYTRYNTENYNIEYYNPNILDWVPLGTGSGSVASVTSADADRITIGGTATDPTVDIAATYVGQSSITTVGALSSGSLAPGFTVVPPSVGGTGVNNGSNTITLGGNLTTSGAFDSTFTMTNTTSVTFPVSGTLATTSQIPTAIPVPLAEGGTNANLTASNGGIFYSTATAGAILAGTATAGQMLRSASSAAPTWSTTVWPDTTTANRLLYSNATNTISEIASANSAMLITNGSGVPSWSGSMTNGQLIIGNTGGTPIKNTLTPAGGIQVTNGAASITIGLPNSIPGRNLLFNGGFNVWQRGASFVPTTYLYGPDRWQCGSGAPTCGFTQVYDADTNSYLIRIQRNVGSSSTAPIIIATSLTNNMSVKVKNSVLTLSFVASIGATYSGSGSTMDVKVVTGETFGTDASFVTTGWTGQTNVLNTTQLVNATPARYTFTTSTTSANTTQVGVLLGFTPTGTAAVADYLQISQVQLEISPTASNFEVVPYPQELQRCQYFYQLIKAGAGYGVGTVAVQMAIQLFQAMRATPAISATGPIAVTDGIANFTQSSFSSISYITELGGLLTLPNYTGLVATRPIAMNPSLNGNGLTFDSELY